jgi:hypothetical protein
VLADALATGSLPRYAIGSAGAVSGPGTGTSDDILAWLSNGEWVHRAKAVDYYGQDFMRAINEMRIRKEDLPKYATGGPVQVAPASQMAKGLREVVDVNLNVGSRRVSLMGEREQVRELVSALKGLEVTR